MRKPAIALVGLLLTAGPALAQHAGHGVTPWPPTNRSTPRPLPAPLPPIQVRVPTTDDLAVYMQGTGVTGAAEILQHREHLALSRDQTRRLEALRDEAAADAAPHVRRAREARLAAAELFKAENPDLEAYETKLWAVGDHKLQAQLATARIAVQARSVLTAEQREALTRTVGAAGTSASADLARPVTGEHDAHH